MAELKRIDEAEQESKNLRDLEFKDFRLEQFSDAGKVANERDPHLKVAADTKLYDLEKRAIQIDIDKHKHENSSDNTDDNSSQSADDYIQPTKVSHVQSPTVSEKYHVDHELNSFFPLAPVTHSNKLFDIFCHPLPIITSSHLLSGFVHPRVSSSGFRFQLAIWTRVHMFDFSLLLLRVGYYFYPCFCK